MLLQAVTRRAACPAGAELRKNEEDRTIAAPDQQAPRRVWRFAECEFSEWDRRLWVREKPVALQPRPLEVLLVLLQADGHSLTRDQILGQVWGGDAEDNSLRVAVNRLRSVLEAPDVIQLIPRVGYKIAVPVYERFLPAEAPPRNGLQKGDPVPGYDEWRLDQPLGGQQPPRVWLALHRQTREAQVFKFADSADGLLALQREKTVHRALKRSARDAGRAIAVTNWRFTSQPYFLQMEYGGKDLAEWAAAQRAAGELTREGCLALMGDLAEAIAAAHEIGILHNDLKPSNILVGPSAAQPGCWQVRIADFGVARLWDPARMSALEITVQGFGTEQDPDRLTGTALYLAPEVGPGRLPTTKADIYALGILLFQLLCGDFRELPSPGWEARIQDALLEEDIRCAANLDPAQRFDSASALARSLRQLPERRAERLQKEAERKAQAEALRAAQRSGEARQRQLDRRDARRPWIVAAMLLLALGLVTSLLLFQHAHRQQAVAEKVNDFLNDDLLAQANPASGKAAGTTLHDAVLEAASHIDREFAAQPAVAARLHESVASALNNLSDYGNAGREYDEAAARWIEAEGPLAEQAISAEFEHAAMDARSYEPGSADHARTLFTREESLFGRLRKPSSTVRLAELAARGTLAMADARPKQALQAYQTATLLAERDPAVPMRRRIVLQQRLCVMEMKSGQAALAETCDRQLIASLHTLYGPAAVVALPEIALTQALLEQNKDREAIQETTSILPEVSASLGPENNLTLQVLATRAAAEGTLGLWRPAVADDLLVAAAAHKHDPHGLLAIGSLSDAALSECRYGQQTQGIQAARQAFAEAHFAGIPPGVVGGTAYTVVNCLLADWQKPIGAPQLAEAERLLGGIDIPAVATITADPGWASNVQLSRAIVATQRRQDVEAARLLAQAEPVLRGPTGDPYQRTQAEALAALLARRAKVEDRSAKVSGRSSGR